MILGKKTRAILGRALGDSTPLVGGRVVSAVLTFALPLVLARLLTPEAFGTYKQFFLIASTVQLTGQLGLTQSLYYFLPRGGKDRGAYLGQAMVSLALLGALFGGAVWLLMPQIGGWIGDGSLAGVRAPLALFAGLMLAAAPLEGSLLSEGRIGAAALTYVLTDGVRATALVLGAEYGGPAGLFWAAAATSGGRLVALLSLAAAKVLPVRRPSVALLRTQLGYALPFAGASYLYVAQRYFAQYAVSASFDAAMFALFAVASFHLPVVDIIFTPLSEVMMVKLGKAAHERDAAGSWLAWDDTVQKLAAILFPATVCAWLFGPTLLPLLFTHKYDASVPLFMVATFEIPLWIFPLDALLRAAGQTRFLFAFNGVRIVVTSVLVIGGIKLFGLRGAIAGGMASEAIARVGMAWRARGYLETSWSSLCNWSSLGRTSAAATVAAVPALALRWLPLPPVAGLVAAALVYAGSYLGVSAALRARRRLPMATGAAPAAVH